MPNISIIVPVYGVEQYIVKCVTSIARQTFNDFECLIINDGTRDNSIELAKQAVGDDLRFVFINKENGGQGSARNLGLDQAKGQYIAFVDSDDYVHPEYLHTMHEALVAEQADIAICDVDYVDLQGNSVAAFKSDAQKFQQEHDFLNSKKYLSNFMWDKLFAAHLFENVRFDTSLRTNEDVYLIFRLLFQRKIVGTGKTLYYYLQRPGATSKAIHPTYFDDRVKIKNLQLAFACQHGLDQEHPEYIAYTYLKTFVFYMITTMARYSDNYAQDIQKLAKELDPQYFTIKNLSMFANSERRIFLSLLAFKLSPRAFRLLARFWFRNHAA